MHADDTLAEREKHGSNPGPNPEARKAAAEWLIELLRDGPVLVNEVERQAKEAGMSWATIRRAKDLLGIVPRKQTFSGGWRWDLPTSEAAQVDPDPARSRSSCSEPAHLRETQVENPTKGTDISQGAQVNYNLSTLADEQENLSTLITTDDCFATK